MAQKSADQEGNTQARVRGRPLCTRPFTSRPSYTKNEDGDDAGGDEDE